MVAWTRTSCGSQLPAHFVSEEGYLGLRALVGCSSQFSEQKGFAPVALGTGGHKPR